MKKMVKLMDMRREKNHKTSTNQIASCVELRLKSICNPDKIPSVDRLINIPSSFTF